jgi:hypothetical protein
MRKIIKIDGTEHNIEGEEPLSLEFMQKTVGGYIEMVYPEDPNLIMVVDEEGQLKQKLYNKKASAIAGQTIVGDVIVCDKKYID